MRSNRSVRSVLTLLAVSLLCALPALAQRTTGTVRGAVTAPDGAIIPGTLVTLTNDDTGIVRTTNTNESGNYVFSGLQVGNYNLSAELDGFKTALVTGIRVNVADVREFNLALELGAISDEITTTADTVAIETIGGDVAGLVTGEQIRELPLNGRNFVQLTQLMPGVSAPDGVNFSNKGLLSGVDLSVSGGSVTGNAWTVDGANNNDVGSNRTILVTPSVDAIEEFKIHRNSYGPEFGGAGGAQINLVTRGGTNDWKGSVYAFHRNDSFNETNFFLEQAGQDTENLDRLDYGFTLGGPIVKDKVHFFISGEWNDEERGTVRTARVPTAAERAGDFSQSIGSCFGPVPIDPLTGQAFAGNVIPDDRLSAGGLALLNLYPNPNVTPSGGSCNNWVAAVDTPIDWEQRNARVDWNVSEKANVLVRYTEDDWVNAAPNAGPANGLWGDDPFPAVDSSWVQPGESLVAQLNNVIGSSIVNTVTFSMSGNEINIVRGADGEALNSQINAAIPTFFPADGKETGDQRSHPVYWGGATGTDLWNIAPWNNDQDLRIFKNDYEQVFGNHFFKAGVLYGDNRKKENCCGASAFETPHFWGGVGIGGFGATSGNRIADILIEGMFHGYDESERQPSPDILWEDLEVYVGDSWKVNSNLTLDLGVRYSRYEEPYAADDDIVSFDPNLFNPALGNIPCNGIAQAPGATPCADAGLIGGGEGVSRGFVETDTDNFAPRFGLAWDVFGTGKSILRTGFGQFYQRERVNIQLDFAGQPPFTRNISGIRSLDTVADGQYNGQGFGIPNRGINPQNETPYNMQFNVTWEQQLGADSTFEIGYVGSRGRHLIRKYDINQIATGDLNGNGISDRLDFVRAGGAGASGVRPFFTGAGDQILFWNNDGESEYDSLQTQFVTRWGRGSQFQASYTWSRLMANDELTSSSAGFEVTQVTDLENPDLDWGYAGTHRDHIFNASVVWNLPTFEGKGGFKQHVLGNWTVAGVASYSSGSPITVYVQSVPGLGGGGFAGTGYANNNRPIRVNNVSCSGGGGNQIINAGAFTLNGLRLGDTSQMADRGACEGPDFAQVDLSLYKNFRIGRFDAQFRIEVFNLFNRDNFIAASVNNVIQPTNVVLDSPDLATATTIVSADIQGNFGEATAVRDPRQIQLGFKLFF